MHLRIVDVYKKLLTIFSKYAVTTGSKESYEKLFLLPFLNRGEFLRDTHWHDPESNATTE